MAYLCYALKNHSRNWGFISGVVEGIFDPGKDSDLLAGASLRRETFSSLLPSSLTRPYCELQLMSSTSSANWSNLENRLISIGPGAVSQVCTEVLLVEFREKLKSLSCGVQLLAVRSD